MIVEMSAKSLFRIGLVDGLRRETDYRGYKRFKVPLNPDFWQFDPTRMILSNRQRIMFPENRGGEVLLIGFFMVDLTQSVYFMGRLDDPFRCRHLVRPCFEPASMKLEMLCPYDKLREPLLIRTFQAFDRGTDPPRNNPLLGDGSSG